MGYSCVQPPVEHAVDQVLVALGELGSQRRPFGLGGVRADQVSHPAVMFEPSWTRWRLLI
ncbi:hypothetical protein MLGJGCBP_06431 [Rhodococcus sp. T7]|nr:hypothetical protein MLGJGCBP_06431 [Rhodococcus sp. T7]